MESLLQEDKNMTFEIIVSLRRREHYATVLSLICINPNIGRHLNLAPIENQRYRIVNIIVLTILDQSAILKN